MVKISNMRYTNALAFLCFNKFIDTFTENMFTVLVESI